MAARKRSWVQLRHTQREESVPAICSSSSSNHSSSRRDTDNTREAAAGELLSGKFSEQSVTWPCVASIFIGVHHVEEPSSISPTSGRRQRV